MTLNFLAHSMEPLETAWRLAPAWWWLQTTAPISNIDLGFSMETCRLGGGAVAPLLPARYIYKVDQREGNPKSNHSALASPAWLLVCCNHCRAPTRTSDRGEDLHCEGACRQPGNTFETCFSASKAGSSGSDKPFVLLYTL